jgi:hypothetical protein
MAKYATATLKMFDRLADWTETPNVEAVKFYLLTSKFRDFIVSTALI